ncbi:MULTISPECIES: extracellular solute-binding protein [Actinoplanes]|uniref:extracellular solute-binding protein n=1 Tax=Actinoplanes TaxID=1865 RepID=UPI0005F29818|nr:MULTISPECIES: extracellular solute-binding protein [Actinoplanes]GLY04200.1 sugar ABC transporter substrate-binding protein [Actinoplanes sp. NBRC 101535]
MFRSRRGLAAGALLLSASLALTACGGGSGEDEGADAKSLTLWHYEGPNSAMGIAWNKAIELFKASHPGVEVKFEEKGFEQIQQNAQMILNSDSAPDILEYNKGNATAGLLSKQGLLTDLTEEVTSRGWDKKLSTSLQTTAKYDEDGVMGSGNFYGVPNYGEYVMVYYNKALFDKYKLAVPTTLDEFTTVMDTFVQNKVTPLAVGGAEYPAQQIFYELALSKADRAFVDDYQLYKNKVDFKGPQLTYGAQTFADWVAKGYIPKDSSGIKAEDMGVSFTQGKFPILISGSWWYGRFADEIKDFEWGTFLFPGNTLHPGSSGNLWVVPEKSKAKALAYDFIDITMQPEVQALLGNSGGVPVAADVSQITDPKNKELIENFNKISTSDGLAFYPDWPAPGYYDVLVAGMQGLISGSKTPDAVLDEIAGPYNENLADLGK